MTTLDRTSTLSVRPTAVRTTPPPPERQFREVLARGGQALLSGAVSAAAFVPGGNVLAAAVRGAAAPALRSLSGVPGGADNSVEAPAQPGAGGGSDAPTDDDVLTHGQDMSMRMLRLQEAISEENRRYTALSNVLHARHEMAKNAIGNIR